MCAQELTVTFQSPTGNSISHPEPTRKQQHGTLFQNYLKERLLDQVQARVSYTSLFWGHSRSIPQGMILMSNPL